MNFVQPDPRTIQALVTLEHNPDYIKVLDWLRAVQAKLDKDGRILTDEIPLRQGQGANQFVDFVLRQSKDARTALSKVRHQQA